MKVWPTFFWFNGALLLVGLVAVSIGLHSPERAADIIGERLFDTLLICMFLRWTGAAE